jgi:hypothetical protein
VGPFLRALLKLVESNHWITPHMWERIIQTADEETLLYLKDEAIPSWKLFVRDDWMDPQTRAHLMELILHRLDDLKDADALHKFFDFIL